MHWDGTVTLGNAIQIVLMIGGLFMLYSKISERLTRIETQVAPMWAIFAERRAPRSRKDDDGG